MKWLSESQIIEMQAQLIAEFGGTPGLRDAGLLESALNAPLQTFGGAPLYPTMLEKCVRLAFSLATNHAFVDGNKRIGALALLVILDLNGIALRPLRPGELSDTFLRIASGAAGYDDLLIWTKEHLPLEPKTLRQ